MKSILRDIDVPAIVDGHTVRTTKFTVTARELPTKVIATINFGVRQIGELSFTAGTSIANVEATIQNLLTPEPYLRRS